MDIVDRDQPRPLRGQQIDNLEIGGFVRVGPDRPALLPEQGQVDLERGRARGNDRAQDRLVAGFAPIGRFGESLGQTPLRFAQDRGLAHAGLACEHDAGRSLFRIVMRDLDDGFDGVARFLEIDPE